MRCSESLLAYALARLQRHSLNSRQTKQWKIVTFVGGIILFVGLILIIIGAVPFKRIDPLTNQRSAAATTSAAAIKAGVGISGAGLILLICGVVNWKLGPFGEGGQKSEEEQPLTAEERAKQFLENEKVAVESN